VPRILKERCAVGEYSQTIDPHRTGKADSSEAVGSVRLQMRGKDEHHTGEGRTPGPWIIRHKKRINLEACRPEKAEGQKKRQIPACDSPPMNKLDVPQSVRARTRSSSIVKVEEVKDRSAEDDLDRNAYLNINADWVNAKGICLRQFHAAVTHSLLGAWLIHVVLIISGKVIIDTIPGMTQEISWTLVNLLYLTVRRFRCCQLPC